MLMARLMPLIACHECDLLQREVVLEPGRVARCGRCGAQLYRSAHKNVDHTLAFIVAAAMLLVVANAFPIVSLSIQGKQNATSLYSAVHDLWQQEMQPIAALVFLTTFLIPAVEITVMIYLLLALKLGRVPAGFTVIMRVLQSVNPWGMVEVFILGILVALVKLTHYGRVVPGLALWSFGILTLLLAGAASSFDVRDVWDRVHPTPSGEETA
jgi:paraquat-inducible protein A